MVLNGQRIRVARESQGISRAALSRELGIDVKTIYNVENDKHPPTTETITKLAARLGVTIDSLYDREPESVA